MDDRKTTDRETLNRSVAPATPAARSGDGGSPERASADWSRSRNAERVRYPGDTRPGGTDDRSIGELLRELRDEGGTLVRKEIELARAEMNEKLHAYQKSLAGIAIGGGLLLAALLLLVEAVNRGLTALFEGWMSLEIAVWLAPLVLAAVVGMIGFAQIKAATSTIKHEGVAPHETIETLKEDKRWVERKVKS